LFLAKLSGDIAAAKLKAEVRNFMGRIINSFMHYR
jgi:hypothetical protein